MTAGATTGRRRRRRLGEAGVAAIEFAAVLPVFLLFILGTIEFARAFQIWNTMLLAVEEGARYAMVHHSDADLATAVQARAQGQLPGVDAANVTIPLPTVAGGTPPTMTITATATFDFVAPGLLPFGPIDLQRQVTVPLTD
jgi:Flp pilus assembly protein TadG